MHIVLTERAFVNSGWVERGTVLDLPEAEARPVIEAGHAEPLHAQPEPVADVVAEPEPAPVAEVDPEPTPMPAKRTRLADK